MKVYCFISFLILILQLESQKLPELTNNDSNKKVSEQLESFLEKVEKDIDIEKTPKEVIESEKIRIDPEVVRMRERIEEESDFIRYTHNKVFERVRRYFERKVGEEKKRTKEFAKSLDAVLELYYN
jgi:hypothetical protein